MRMQQWFTVGVSTIAAGTIASVVFPSKPIAIVAASAAGAISGTFVTGIDQTAERLARLENLLGLPNHDAGAIPFKKQLNSVKHDGESRKRTAILYDVENLLKGYNFSRTLIDNLSLTKVIQAVQATGKVGPILIQKAYANWSDPRLKVMRIEINELGIDPIQVFGFSREPTKNAADIQLVIDAINLLNFQSSIDVFVIVSGDGGFASLAKQLHEQGKTVIGCAYENSTSKTFQAVCDDFVLIDDPEQYESRTPVEKPILAKRQFESSVSPRPEPSIPNPSRSNNPLGLDPRNARLVTHVHPTTSSLPEDTLSVTRDVLQWYATDSVCRSDLSQDGIYLSVVEQAISHTIPELETVKLGLPKFVEYMQYVCKDSELCIARIPPSKVMLMLRDAVPEDAHILPDVNIREVHTVETYRSILETGKPIYRIPQHDQLYPIAMWMLRHSSHQSPLGPMIESIVSDLDDKIAPEIVKQTLFSCLSAGILIRGRDSDSVSEQTLSFRQGVTSLSMLMCALKIGAAHKLKASLPYVDEEILQQIVPDISDEP
ncbi:MAG: NYN domain-containing protein [Cyanobacteria bacterium P01_E01_bin.6]